MNKRLWIIVIGLVITAVLGVLVGNWWSDRMAVNDKTNQIDEHVGLGSRTGLTGEVELQVQPMTMTVVSGDPVTINLTLINKTDRSLVMNDWLTPIPAGFANNQFPFKVVCTRENHRVDYQGNIVVKPGHGRRDFFDLKPGEKSTVTADISRGPEKGRWEIMSPGTYKFEVWYESYLTGRAAGLHAWTGMTNHAVVTVNVVPKGE